MHKEYDPHGQARRQSRHHHRSTTGHGRSPCPPVHLGGAKVVLTDVNEAGGSALAVELGENALFIKHDVTSLDEWKSVVEQAEAAFGPVTILVNNAGILGPIANAVDIDPDAYLAVINVNQHSQVWGMKAVIPSTIKAGGGNIVNISSTAGMLVVAGAVAYGPQNIGSTRSTPVSSKPR